MSRHTHKRASKRGSLIRQARETLRHAVNYTPERKYYNRLHLEGFPHVLAQDLTRRWAARRGRKY